MRKFSAKFDRRLTIMWTSPTFACPNTLKFLQMRWGVEPGLIEERTAYSVKEGYEKEILQLRLSTVPALRRLPRRQECFFPISFSLSLLTRKLLCVDLPSPPNQRFCARRKFAHRMQSLWQSPSVTFMVQPGDKWNVTDKGRSAN